MMGITDPYTAYCFDEACAFILTKVEDGEKPIISKRVDKKSTKIYSKPSDIYKKFSN